MKNLSLYAACAVVICFANDNDCFVPEVWAAETLARLHEKKIMAGMVHTDFNDEVRDFGDTVNTRRPNDFYSDRKDATDDVTEQDAVSTNVQVKLNQHAYVSYLINDREASLSFKQLVDLYLDPAADALARQVDRILLGQVARVLSTNENRAGRLGALSASTAKDWILEAREILNKRNVPDAGRNLMLSPSSETAVLKTDMFIKANERGDGGSALENARLGRILGFDTFRANNTPHIVSGGEVASGTVTNALAAGGSGSQATTITGYNVLVGEFAVVAGNDQPTIVTAVTLDAGDTDAVTLNEANKYGTDAGAAIKIYKACDVNGNYSAGHSKRIVVDGFAANTGPQVGQILAFGTSTRHTYVVIERTVTSSTEYSLLLDRPLEYSLANNDLAFPGPYGAFNLAFTRNSIALVNRPLVLPRSGSGVMAGSAVVDNVSLRVVMQYDSKKQATRVNMDMLLGVAILDDDMALPLLG
jgi:hypothetical protein